MNGPNVVEEEMEMGFPPEAFQPPEMMMAHGGVPVLRPMFDPLVLYGSIKVVDGLFITDEIAAHVSFNSRTSSSLLQTRFAKSSTVLGIRFQTTGPQSVSSISPSTGGTRRSLKSQ